MYLIIFIFSEEIQAGGIIPYSKRKYILFLQDSSSESSGSDSMEDSSDSSDSSSSSDSSESMENASFSL